jgi:probable HAF family extracellular repeat protein
MTRTRNVLAGALAAGALLAAAGPANAAVEYQVQVFRGEAGIGNQRAPLFALNNHGVAIGESVFGDTLSATPIITSGNVFTRLGLVGDPTVENSFGTAFDLNDTATVVGDMQGNESNTDRPFIWPNGGPGKDLGIFPGHNVRAEGINENGDIVGTDKSTLSAYLLHRNGNLETLPPLATGFNHSANGINDTGTVVGQSSKGTNGVFHATSWKNGKVKDLGVLGKGDFSAALDINDSGVAVGLSTTGKNQRNGQRAAMFVNGTVVPLNFPNNSGLDDNAEAINNAGVIVGVGAPDAGGNASHAIRYQNGAAVDLNTLIPADSGVFLARALDVNELGQIAGSGVDTRTGVGVGFILTPLTQ